MSTSPVAEDRAPTRAQLVVSQWSEFLHSVGHGRLDVPVCLRCGDTPLSWARHRQVCAELGVAG